MKIKGKLEQLNREGLIGWFAEFGEPADRPVLEVLIDGEVIGRCQARQPRADVEAAGFGDGRCGFSFVFPKDLSDEQIARTRVRFAGTELYIETPAEALALRQRNRKETTARKPDVAGAWPVFIVGSPRSGTSILVQSLLAAGYHGFREGNLLGLMRPLLTRIDEHFRVFGTDNAATLMSRVKSDALRQEVLAIFKRVLDENHPDAPWLDKTGNPDTVMIFPHLVGLWPNCRIIFAKRRGIENIVSRMRKFPEHGFRYHCRDWAENMHAWREVREQLDATRYIEVDQHDMVTRPDFVAAGIGTLLALSPPQRQKVEETFRAERPQQSATGTAERVLTLETTKWNAEQLKAFTESCGPEMEVFGYSLDDNYHQHGAV